MEREGHEVQVIAPHPTGAFGWPGVAARLRAAPWRAFGAARWIVHARRELASANAERIVCHWVVPSVFPIALGGRARVEGVSHGADVRLLLALPAPIRARMVRAIVARVALWRFVSEALLARLTDGLTDATRDLVRAVAIVAPSPIEIPDVADRARQRRLEIGAPLFVAVGRLVRSKRFDRAIEYIAAHERGARLVLVGDGPERARLLEHARRRGVDARFVGKVSRDDALAWIGAADALFHASDEEGLSTVVREAELLGVPVERLNETARRGHP